MTDKNIEFVTELECDHCGGIAIESADGLFYDGDGGECQSCGFPGMVSVYEDDDGVESDDGTCYGASWQESDDESVVCNDQTCEECREKRAKDGGK